MQINALYLRTIIFGVTDSLVSTVGLLAGIDVAGAPHTTIALTGLVYAFVEAFSMAVGSFLSEESAVEYSTQAKSASREPVFAGVVMFLAFVIASFVPLVPYLIFLNWIALAVSIAVSVLFLFIVGLISARFSRLPMIRRGLRMALLGGTAILMGVVIGLLVPAAG